LNFTKKKNRNSNQTEPMKNGLVVWFYPADILKNIFKKTYIFSSNTIYFFILLKQCATDSLGEL